MPTLVFELGTEEMPANAVAPALEQLLQAATSGLAEARLAPGKVEVFGTPRRLILCAEGVPQTQPDQTREVRGPAVAAAFDAAGKPTGAALGFAKKQGVPVEALERLSTPQGDYVLARVLDRGRPAVEVIGGVLVEALKGLSFPKTMRWGAGGMKFVRPVRWIVCMLDDAVVPMEFAGIASSNRTRGHRYLAPGEVELPDADALPGALQSAFVMVDPTERRERIVTQADALAAEHGGTVPWDDDLLDENTWLVEWPTVLSGSFDPAYLDLPRPVLVTAMKKHQRFFPLEDAAGKLLPRFISVRNGGTEHLDTVRRGNERVLAARFADAAHFYAQDQAETLDSMAERLDRLVFQEKLGTVAQKRARLIRLAGVLCETSGLADRKEAVLRAAVLCKADLTSRMVVELPALQGVIGREYALAAGEDPAVADAIAEHYLPRGASDPLPLSRVGRLLAVADRIDTLVGYVGLGILPSGSSDPFGLRRAAQGLVQILAEEPDMPPLVELQVLAARVYDDLDGLDFDLDKLCNDMRGLFDQRLAALLAERGVRYDLVDAVLSGGLLYNTLVHGVVLRADVLQELSSEADFVSVVQAAARCASILKSSRSGPAEPLLPGKEGIHGAAYRSVQRAVSVLQTDQRNIEAALLTEPAERALFDSASSALPEVARRATDYDYRGLYETLAPLRAPIDAFFDQVLVMAEDGAVRRNRLALVGLVDALFKSLADFTKVVVV